MFLAVLKKKKKVVLTDSDWSNQTSAEQMTSCIVRKWEAQKLFSSSVKILTVSRKIFTPVLKSEPS